MVDWELFCTFAPKLRTLNKFIMEFKASKETLQNLINMIEEERTEKEREAEEARQRRIEYKRENGYFMYADDLISYVLGGELCPNGRTVYADSGFALQPEEIKRDPNDRDKIIHYRMEYNDIDMPIGMFNHSMSVLEFIYWMKSLNDFKIDGFIPEWHK